VGWRGPRSLLLRVAVSVGLLALLVAFVDWRRLGRLLAGADPAFLALVVLLATADRLLMAWKWWLLIRGRAAAVSLWAAVRAYYLASFAGYFLPMTVGADAIRVTTLAGGGRTAGLVASVVLERVVGALAQAVLATVSVGTLVALGLGARIGPAQRWILGGLVVLAFGAFPFSFPVARWAANRLGPGAGWRRWLGSLAQSYASYASSVGLVVLFFGLTLVEGGFPVAIHYTAGRALGLDPGWTLYIATVPLVFLVARLPVSLGGLGFLELSFVSLAGLLGLGWTDAFLIAGLSTVLYIVALAPGAVLYLFPDVAPQGARRVRLP
jgi:uncharacterized membrane protein YbhN (UPF0104 family)